jgi:hypothetical protein
MTLGAANVAAGIVIVVIKNSARQDLMVEPDASERRKRSESILPPECEVGQFG